MIKIQKEVEVIEVFNSTPIQGRLNRVLEETVVVKEPTEEDAYRIVTELNLKIFMLKSQASFDKILSYKKKELDNKIASMQFDRLLKEWKEKDTIQELTLDLKFNLPLD